MSGPRHDAISLRPTTRKEYRLVGTNMEESWSRPGPKRIPLQKGCIDLFLSNLFTLTDIQDSFMVVCLRWEYAKLLAGWQRVYSTSGDVWSEWVSNSSLADFLWLSPIDKGLLSVSIVIKTMGHATVRTILVHYINHYQSMHLGILLGRD